MLNLAIPLSLLLIMLEAFQFTFRYGIASRAFYSISPHVIEQGVAWPGFQNEQDEPYYDSERLEASVRAFLAERLFPELDEFQLGFHYYVAGTGMLCSEYCQGVIIKIKAPLLSWYDYEAQSSYEIQANP
ncbi:MAG: hypothetical protein WC399_01930 [Bacilli bacterium]